MMDKELIKELYIYGYPIVGMYELLYNQVINKEGKCVRFNEFAHTATVASPKTSFIPAPNNDTTYSRAWLDLREEAVIINMPSTEGRYYSIQVLNLFSETLINVEKRTTGTDAKSFAIVGPNWKGKLPENLYIIESDTTFALAFLRILINDEADVEVVKKIQNEIKITYLSEVANKRAESLPVYKNSNGKEFFKCLSDTLKLTPVMKEEEIKRKLELVENMPEELIEESCKEAKEIIDRRGMSFGEEVNFWRMARKGIGNYGSDYMQRSVVWHKGALANQSVESLYPSTFQDNKGEMLDGNFNYKLSFEEGKLPPVSQFWSLTMYIFKNAFLYDNEIDRYSIGDRTKGLVYEEDGSLNIYIQREMPEEEEKRANWLPAPKEKFYMTLRLYGPDDSAINGQWKPPAVEKLD